MSVSFKWNLGVDGGATKTLARIEDRQKTMSFELKSGPSSFSVAPDKAISNTLELVTSLLEKANANANDVAFIGGFAGIANENNTLKLQNSLKEIGFHKPEIVSDAYTSFYGASGGIPSVVIALGTGSIASTLTTDREFRLTGGWGFKIDDKASGAVIGRMAIQTTMLELEEKTHACSDFTRAITAITGPTQKDTQAWVNLASSTDFAAIAPVVLDLVKKKDKIALTIMQACINDLEALIVRADKGLKLPLTFVGGLAPTYRKLCSGDYMERWFDPKGTSLDGACLLANNKQP